MFEWAVIETKPAPCVVIVDLEARRHTTSRRFPSAAERLDPRSRLLEAGAGHLDAVADLERVMARAAAAQVSEWAAAEAAARLRLPHRIALARLSEAVVLVDQLPATLAALEAGAITAAHASALVGLLEPVSDDKRTEVEAAALERAGTQTVGNLRARVRRIIAKLDAAAALRRLVAAAKGRKVALYGDDDGMSTLAALLPGPLARACYETIKAYATACEFDDEGNRDPRSL